MRRQELGNGLSVFLLAIQAYNTFLAPPPTSDRAFAVTALVAYAVFAVAIWWLDDRPVTMGPPNINLSRRRLA